MVDESTGSEKSLGQAARRRSEEGSLGCVKCDERDRLGRMVRSGSNRREVLDAHPRSPGGMGGMGGVDGVTKGQYNRAEESAGAQSTGPRKVMVGWLCKKDDYSLLSCLVASLFLLG